MSSFNSKAEELISFIQRINLPEIDLDQYFPKDNISVTDYANKKTSEFRTDLSNSNAENSKGSSSSFPNMDAKMNVSTDENLSNDEVGSKS